MKSPACSLPPEAWFLLIVLFPFNQVADVGLSSFLLPRGLVLFLFSTTCVATFHANRLGCRGILRGISPSPQKEECSFTNDTHVVIGLERRVNTAQSPATCQPSSFHQVQKRADPSPPRGPLSVCPQCRLHVCLCSSIVSWPPKAEWIWRLRKCRFNTQQKPTS